MLISKSKVQSVLLKNDLQKKKKMTYFGLLWVLTLKTLFNVLMGRGFLGHNFQALQEKISGPQTGGVSSTHILPSSDLTILQWQAWVCSSQHFPNPDPNQTT